MPSIPLYNQEATEEAGLTRAKRRVIKAMKSGIAKLTERPDVDPTQGSADQLAKLLISQYEDLTALSRQIVAYMGDGSVDVEMQPDEAIKALKLVIIAAKLVSRIVRLAKGLTPNMRFLDLGIMGDLKAVQDECNTEFYAALRGLRSLRLPEFSPEQMDRIENYQDPELETVLSEWDDEDDDLSTVGSISLGTKRSDNSTVSKSGSTRSGNTKTKGSPPGSKLGVRPKQARVNTMFRYMFGAAEDLRDAGVSMSLDRPPPGGKGTPRPRGLRGRVPQVEQEEVDEDMTRSIARGQRMAEMEEEEDYQNRLKEEGRALLQDDAANMILADADREVQNAINKVQAEKVPFTAFSQNAYLELVDMLQTRFMQASEMLYAGFLNFNAYREQKVLPARAADADVGNAVKTGAGMYGDMVQGTASNFYGVTPHIQNIYRVGGSSDILYRREGLPRFL